MYSLDISDDEKGWYDTPVLKQLKEEEREERGERGL
jgi:hypothetical protein